MQLFLWILVCFAGPIAQADVIIESDEQQLVRVTSDYYSDEFTDIRVWVQWKRGAPQIKGFRIKDYSMEALQSARVFDPKKTRSVSLANIPDKGVSLRDILSISIATLRLDTDFSEEKGGEFKIDLMSHAPTRRVAIPLHLALDRLQWKTGHGALAHQNVTRAHMVTRYAIGIPTGLRSVTLKTSQGSQHVIQLP